MAAPGLLVISDSQWKYAVPEVQEFGEFDVSVILVSGMQVHQVDSTMLLATEFFNDTVVHLGTNNLICGEFTIGICFLWVYFCGEIILLDFTTTLCTGETPERVVEHQQELLTRIRLRNPKVRLFLFSVLKRRVNYFKSWTLQRNLYIEEMNLKIDKLNMLMKQLALRMNVVFIDNWREFEAQSQDSFEFLLGRDGLHLSRRGLRVLTGNVYRACLQARRDYPRSLACLPPAPSPASSPAPSPASSPASSSAPSPGHHPLPSPSFSDGAGMNASLPSFSYSDALCSNLPLHNDLMQVSSFQPSVRPLHLPSVTRTNASSYSSPPLSPSSSTPSCFKFTTVTRRGNHHCNKPKIVPKHSSSSFKIPLNNRWSSLSSLNDSFMPSFSSVANCTKKQSCIKKKSISPTMFPSSAFCRPSSLPLISDVRNTNKDGTTREFPARLSGEYGVGYPVAHFITSHLDEETLTYLLQSIMDRSPDLHVNAVMTDGDEALVYRPEGSHRWRNTKNGVLVVPGPSGIHLPKSPGDPSPPVLCHSARESLLVHPGSPPLPSSPRPGSHPGSREEAFFPSYSNDKRYYKAVEAVEDPQKGWLRHPIENVLGLCK
ncbi:uncharacterized protein LOC124155283 [Ischnura elegans]|uniref:uncharacterized protein LOC124155283 n=1 Tax=Ischnura elegans TaxID=197161 RepID=UPI001ED8BF48|nr:uncharacterized protein LOC124155283 [Ischnura elegans]